MPARSPIDPDVGAAVRRFLARGRLARLLACAAVALAGIVWLSVAVLVLRVVLVAVLVLAASWCAWLVAAVWWTPLTDRSPPGSAALHGLWTRIRHAASLLAAGPATAETAGAGRPETDEALEALRGSVDALRRELLGRRDRAEGDGERLARELAGGIEQVRAVAARIEQVERDVERLVADGHRPAPDDEAAARRERDVPAALAELELDFRLDELEQREQQLVEREQRLERRERELKAFVAETQSSLSVRA